MGWMTLVQKELLPLSITLSSGPSGSSMVVLHNEAVVSDKSNRSLVRKKIDLSELDRVNMFNRGPDQVEPGPESRVLQRLLD